MKGDVKIIGQMCSKMALLLAKQIAEFLHWLYLKNEQMNQRKFLHGNINSENVKVELIIL